MRGTKPRRLTYQGVQPSHTLLAHVCSSSFRSFQSDDWDKQHMGNSKMAEEAIQDASHVCPARALVALGFAMILRLVVPVVPFV